MTVDPIIRPTVRLATTDDARFVVETTAKVRQPHSLTWYEWEPYGTQWAEFHFHGGKTKEYGGAWVAEEVGIGIFAFVLCLNRPGPRAVECLFVKRDFRGLGLGRLLLDAAGFEDYVPCREPTPSWRHWCLRRGIRYAVIV